MFLISCFGYVLLGAILYVLDRVYGVALRRAIWNTTHGPDNRLGSGNAVGFFHGRFIKSRLFTVGFLMFAQFMVGFFAFHYNPVSLLMWSVLGTVLIVTGTYFGPLTDRFFSFANTSLDSLEDRERRIYRGESTLGAEVGSVARTATNRAREAVYPISRPSGSSRAYDDPEATVVQPPRPAQKPEDDGRAKLDGFIGRGGKK